jgi:hypothetical protein
MGERADQIEQNINRSRNDLTGNIQELEQKVKSAFDWKTQLEDRPMLLLGIAFGGGILASALLPSGRRRHRRYSDEPTPKTTRNGATKSADTLREKSKQTFDRYDALKGALISVAASRLGGVVGDLLSGYKNEVRRAKQATSSSD